MSNILLLVHRLPYPPNKGDKVRSYHLLKHIAARHQVYLGTFIDDPADEVHIETVRSLCAETHVARINPRLAKLRSLNGLISNQALTLGYYRDTDLQAWVNKICADKKIHAAVIFSSAMAQYVAPWGRLTKLVDFVDVDSAKWSQYGQTQRGPKAWVYRREGHRLLAYERSVALASARSFFVTEGETELFRKLAPECSLRVEPMCNGVDSEYFAPNPAVVNPFGVGSIPLVFTGAMDYFPNIDGVKWFVEEVLPRLLARRLRIHFYIVGRSPSPEVQRLAGPHVTVTGTVDDVRPYLQNAAVVVASLRIARGVQNKILEAMAMGRPVVASKSCAGGVDGVPGEHLQVAETPEEFAEEIDGLLSIPGRAVAIGHAARQRVIDRYSWQANMSVIDRYLGPASSGAQAREPA